MASILVKFFTKSKEQYDAMRTALGIPFAEAEIVSKQADAAHEQAIVNKMRSMGAEPVRPGRADTGSQTFGPNGLQNVTVLDALRNIASPTMRLVEMSAHRKPARDKKTGEQVPGAFNYVVQAVFSSEDTRQTMPNADEGLKRLFAFVEGKICNTVHVWDNGGVHTVNCSGGFQQGQPKRIVHLCWDGREFSKKMVER